MKYWFFFTQTAGADILVPSNYSNPTESKPTGDGVNKLLAIYARDAGNGQPVIDHSEVSRDFIRAVSNQSDFGIVALNTRYHRRENLFSRFHRILTDWLHNLLS